MNTISPTVKEFSLKYYDARKHNPEDFSVYLLDRPRLPHFPLYSITNGKYAVVHDYDNKQVNTRPLFLVGAPHPRFHTDLMHKFPSESIPHIIGGYTVKVTQYNNLGIAFCSKKIAQNVADIINAIISQEIMQSDGSCPVEKPDRVHISLRHNMIIVRTNDEKKDTVSDCWLKWVVDHKGTAVTRRDDFQAISILRKQDVRKIGEERLQSLRASGTDDEVAQCQEDYSKAVLDMIGASDISECNKPLRYLKYDDENTSNKITIFPNTWTKCPNELMQEEDILSRIGYDSHFSCSIL